MLLDESILCPYLFALAALEEPGNLPAHAACSMVNEVL